MASVGVIKQKKIKWASARFFFSFFFFCSIPRSYSAGQLGVFRTLETHLWERNQSSAVGSGHWGGDDNLMANKSANEPSKNMKIRTPKRGVREREKVESHRIEQKKCPLICFFVFVLVSFPVLCVSVFPFIYFFYFKQSGNNASLQVSVGYCKLCAVLFLVPPVWSV